MHDSLDLVGVMFDLIVDKESCFEYLRSLKLDGHAIEARLYCEDPSKDFMPTPGILDWVEWPIDKYNCRVDTWVDTGSTVTPFYDAMIAKVCVVGAQRETALVNISRVLNETKLSGTTTNLLFLQRLVTDKDFVKGEYTTSLIQNLHDDVFSPSGITIVTPGIYTSCQGKFMTSPFHERSWNFSTVIAVSFFTEIFIC